MGIYEITSAPFGPKNAPSWYQQLMAGVVLAGILYLICEIYVDAPVFKVALIPKQCRLGLFEIESLVV